MALQEGRFTASAEGRSKGVTLLVPRQVVEAEQRELMDYITSAKVQNLIVFLRRGGLRHLDVNEPIRNGEHKGLNPLHVAINKTNASVVSALLELATGVSPDARSKAGDRPLHLACAVGDVGMVRALIEYKADANLTNNKRLTPLLVAAANAKLSGHSRFFISAADTYSEEETPALLAKAYPNAALKTGLGGFSSVISNAAAHALIGFEPQHSWCEY